MALSRLKIGCRFSFARQLGLDEIDTCSLEC